MKKAATKLDVKILLADDESFMREIIVNALSAGGYREIRPVLRLAQLEEVLDANYPDLLIINGEMSDGDAVDLARRIRLFQVGRNPFIPIVMTSWNADGTFVRRVVDGGIDVLVTKPFAAGQLFARIDFLIENRPPFVATANYLGPDRRKVQRGSEVQLFDVPNTLRERIDGRIFDPEDLTARISKTYANIRRQRKTMQETQIGRLFAALSTAAETDKSSEAIADTIESLTTLVETYGGEIEGSSPKSAGIARKFAEMLKDFMSAGTAISAQQCARLSEFMNEMGIEVPANPENSSGNLSGGCVENDIYIQAGGAAA